MPDMIKFLQGKRDSLAAQDISNGTLWFTTDEGAIYLDTEGKRVRFGDYVMVNTVADLPQAGHAYETALYYVKSDNILARWDKTANKWIQLNAAGLSEISVGGEADGNVLSSVDVVVDEKGRKKLTFTKTSVATTESINGLQKQVNDIDAAYKEADAALLGTAQDDSTKETIRGARALANEALNKATENAGDISELDGKLQEIEGTVEGHTTSIGELVAKDGELEGAIGDLEDAYKAADEALEKRIVAGTNGDSTYATGDYKNINALSGAVKAAEGQITELSGTVDGHTTAIGGLTADLGTLNDTVNGSATTEGTVDYRIAQLRKEILTDGAANDAISDAYDTIQEIAAWLGDENLGKDAGEIISELNALTGTVGGISDKINELEADHATIRDEHDADVEALEGDIAALKTELVGQETTDNLDYKTIAALSGALKSNIEAVGTLDGTVGGHTTAIGNLQTETQNIRTDFAAADKALKDALVGQDGVAGIAYATIKALSEALKTAEGKITENEGAISTLDGTVQGHTTSIGNLVDALTWGTF